MTPCHHCSLGFCAQPTLNSTQLVALNAFFDRVVSEDRRVLIFVVSIATAPIFVQAVREHEMLLVLLVVVDASQLLYRSVSIF